MLCCENCHAPIAEESAKCPYCGALNVIGGEKQYMEQLYDIRKGVEELSDAPAREYRREIGKQMRTYEEQMGTYACAKEEIWEFLDMDPEILK